MIQWRNYCSKETDTTECDCVDCGLSKTHFSEEEALRKIFQGQKDRGIIVDFMVKSPTEVYIRPYSAIKEINLNLEGINCEIVRDLEG
jgi:hypothetical protein